MSQITIGGWITTDLKKMTPKQTEQKHIKYCLRADWIGTSEVTGLSYQIPNSRWILAREDSGRPKQTGFVFWYCFYKSLQDIMDREKKHGNNAA